MLRTLSSLYQYTLWTKDGELGKVNDVFFEDTAWDIRYLVVDLNRWLPGRRLLIPPSVSRRPQDDEGRIPIEMTRDSIRTAPPVTSDQPVSRQLEDQLHSFFGWQPYWSGEPEGGTVAPKAPEGDEMIGDRQSDSVPGDAPRGNPHLRSARDMVGYGVEALSGAVGVLSDLLIDDATWMVRYLVVDIGQSGSSHLVVIAVDSVETVDWSQLSLFLDMRKVSVERAPSFEEAPVIPEALEHRLERHYHA